MYIYLLILQMNDETNGMTMNKFKFEIKKNKQNKTIIQKKEE